MIKMEIHGAGIKLFTNAIRDLGSQAKAEKAYAMALNKTIRKVNTVVKRTVAKQVGVTQATIVKRGALRVVVARPGKLSAEIASSGGYMPLKDFKPSQSAKGVSAGPWGKRRVFPHTFLDGGTAGGHVFKNTGRFNKVSGRNNSIKKLFGPAVPNELVKDESAKAFQQIAATQMPIEVARAVNVLTKGIVR